MRKPVLNWICLILVLLASCSNKKAAPARMKFTVLSAQDIARLNDQRRIVQEEARKRLGAGALTKTRDDLKTLQRLLDERAFGPGQTYELQCLGVVFGDVLASEMP